MGVQGEISRAFLYDRGENLKSDLDIAVRVPSALAASSVVVNKCLVPQLQPVDVAGRLLLQEIAHFLQLAPSRACVVQKITQLARIWLDFLDSLLKLWITF